MNPPAGTLRTELNEAVVGGIRQRGAEAVGVVIVGMARLLVGMAILAALLSVSWIFGVDITAIRFATMTGVSSGLSWVATRRPRADNYPGPGVERT